MLELETIELCCDGVMRKENQQKENTSCIGSLIKSKNSITMSVLYF